MIAIGKKGSNGEEMLHHLKTLGTKYKQDSILHKAATDEHAHLHGTSNNSSWLKKDEKHNVGSFHPNRAAEFSSHLKGNKSFTFTENYDEVKFLMDNDYFNAKDKQETIVYTLS